MYQIQIILNHLLSAATDIPFSFWGSLLGHPDRLLSKLFFMFRGEKICSLLSLPSHAHSKFNPLAIERSEICYPGARKCTDMPLYLSVFICMWAQNKKKRLHSGGINSVLLTVFQTMFKDLLLSLVAVCACACVCMCVHANIPQCGCMWVQMPLEAVVRYLMGLLGRAPKFLLWIPARS